MLENKILGLSMSTTLDHKFRKVLIVRLIVWCLTPFSTVFQLYRGSQCTYPCFPGVHLYRSGQCTITTAEDNY